jgi:hypothetical protein
MAKNSPRPKTDHVRIVPLATPEVIERAAPPEAAHLVYNNGPLIANAEVFTIFWGSAWQQRPLANLISEVNGFFDFILSSALVDQLREYSVPQYQIGHGKRIGTLALTTPDVSKKVDDSAIQKTIQQQISAGKLTAANANLIYFVFLPRALRSRKVGRRHAKCSAAITMRLRMISSMP